ncbi:GNAT family N-acetyltransferase [Isoptericola sp. b441]|uniref:GNAT family N-acetyltransferase n=1 Tax=Actinotalea lenta TaxID=3064654 RepID=A0ABT9D8N2_9CELL|nr:MULTISPECIES: GNAT family N-acetyltransferase [unclassified Isoptericola]MDO8107252.1 GNAT family N-acetyltransferase [Isoptericola sp. b441]MDO8121085.1 GNAT family N-acetyltransferase [Isoptericola sp. b490]
MTLPPGYRIVDVPAESAREWLVADAWAFPGDIDPDTALEWPSALDWTRTRGVRADDGELVGTHASFAYHALPVPGGRVAAAGLTWVGVHPGHRRRGLLRAMITDHVRRSLDRGEVLSLLFAAEPAIYGRFGYGLAAHQLRLTIPRGAALRDVPGADDVRIRLETVDPERHGAAVAAVHGSVDRPGWTARESAPQAVAFLHDPHQLRGGAEPMRIALAERDGVPVGYALLRRKIDWQRGGPRGVVRVREICAPEPAVARALWGVLVDLDLTSSVEAGCLAVDDAVVHLLVDVRAAQPDWQDNVWARVLDVPAALGARRYARDIDVVLELSDTLVPANGGRWRLAGGPDGAEVTATRARADLALDVRELGAAYLGGVSLAALASAGLVTERRAGALLPAAAAFGWPVAPVASFVW